jgi:hypothetical protein
MLFSFFWVIPRRLNFMYRRFGPQCLHLYRWCLRMKMEQCVPKRRHIKFIRRRITQKRTRLCGNYCKGRHWVIYTNKRWTANYQFIRFKNNLYSSPNIISIIDDDADPSGRSLAGNVGSNPGEGMDVCLLWTVLLSGGGVCDELTTPPEESNRMWCAVVCDLETSRMRWSALDQSATRRQWWWWW